MRKNIITAIQMLAEHLYPDHPIHVDKNLRLWLGEPRRLQPFDLYQYICRMMTTPEKAEKLVIGKKVVLVGGGPLDEGMGEEIDSFDVVARCNNGFRATTTAPSRCGSRTDLLYHCCGVGKPEDWPYPGEWPDVPVVLAADAERNPHKLAKLVIQCHEQETRQVACIPKDFFIRYGRTRGLTAPNTGTIAALHLCGLAAEVHTRGMTFFADGYDPSYKDWSPEEAAAFALSAHCVEEQRKWMAVNRPKNLYLCPAGEDALSLKTLHHPPHRRTAPTSVDTPQVPHDPS